MAIEVKTVQERLEKRADERLTAEIAEASEKLTRLIRVGHGIFLADVLNPQGERLAIDALLNKIKNAIYLHYQPRYRDDEIAAFMNEVDAVRDRVEQLENIASDE